MMQDTKKMKIYDLLKSRIETGHYPPGCRLPKEVELASQLNVARITLRPALELLEMEKFITRIKGRGTFVRGKQDNGTRVMVLTPPTMNGPEQISNPYFYILPHLQTAAVRMNMHLDICETQSLLTSDPEQCAGQIRASGVEGIFWLGNGFTGKEPVLPAIRLTGLSVLLPHAYEKDAEITGFSVMGTNYSELMKDGLKYLAVQGHRRVGCVSYVSMRGIDPEDYFRWVQSNWLDPDPGLLRLIQSYDDSAEVDRAVGSLLDLKEPPTAILSYSDPFSIRIYEYLKRRGVQIPDDMAVLTIGGQIGCDFMNPPLSSLEYGDQGIAETAVKIMLELIRNQRRLGFIVSPHKLVIRESTKRILLHHNKQNTKTGGTK